MLLVPIASSFEAVGSDFDNPAGWDLATRFYARIYGMPAAICNRVGLEGGANFWGGSTLIDPFGKIIERASGDEEQLTIGDIDFGHLRQARFQLPKVRDSNLSVIQSEMKRLHNGLGVAGKD